METILITGADGVVAANLAVALAGKRHVHVVGWNGPVELPGCQSVDFPATDAAALSQWIAQQRPAHVLYAGPWSESSWDGDVQTVWPKPGEAAWHAQRAASAAASNGGRFTVVSTDSVFTGPHLFHDEYSAATADSAQAHIARAVEEAVALSSALIVRTHAYGASLNGRPHFAWDLWSALHDGSPRMVQGASYATPIFAGDLAEMIDAAWGRNLQGVYHMAGGERCSPYRFAQELSAMLGRGPSPIQLAPVHSNLSRPACETSLNCRRARLALEHPAPNLRDGLRRFVASLQTAAHLSTRLRDAA